MVPLRLVGAIIAASVHPWLGRRRRRLSRIHGLVEGLPPWHVNRGPRRYLLQSRSARACCCGLAQREVA